MVFSQSNLGFVVKSAILYTVCLLVGVTDTVFANDDGSRGENHAKAVKNQPPVLASIGNKSVNEAQALAFTVTATDPDATTPILSASRCQRVRHLSMAPSPGRRGIPRPAVIK